MSDSQEHAEGPQARLTHAGLHVRDLESMERFYVDLLGFVVTDRGELPRPDGGTQSLTFLSGNPDEHHELVLVSGRPDDDHFNVLNQLSYRVERIDDLREFERRLVADAAASDIQPVTHGNAISLYARDPEENRLEFYLDTPWYVSQPVREPVDLSLSDEDLLASIERIIADAPGLMSMTDRRAEMVELMGHES